MRPKIIHRNERLAILAYTAKTLSVRLSKNPIDDRTADPSTTAPQIPRNLLGVKCLDAYLSRLTYQYTSRKPHSRLAMLVAPWCFAATAGKYRILPRSSARFEKSTSSNHTGKNRSSNPPSSRQTSLRNIINAPAD